MMFPIMLQTRLSPMIQLTRLLLVLPALLLAPLSTATAEDNWTYVLQDQKLKLPKQPKPRPDISFEAADGAFLITDKNSEAHGLVRIAYPLEDTGSASIIVEAKVKLIEGHAVLMVVGSQRQIAMELTPGKLFFGKQTAEVDTTGFHVYRIVLSKALATVSVDGKELLSGPSSPLKESIPANQIMISTGDSSNTGQSAWEFVRFLLE